jgi:hypothetical protein
MKPPMRNWLRQRLEAHLTPLIEAIYSRTYLGKRAQWNLVADSCAALFQHAGAALGDEAPGLEEGLAFVKVAGSPLCNPQTGYFTLEYQDRCETFRARSGCCLYYRAEEGGEKCTTCVLRRKRSATNGCWTIWLVNMSRMLPYEHSPHH